MISRAGNETHRMSNSFFSFPLPSSYDIPLSPSHTHLISSHSRLSFLLNIRYLHPVPLRVNLDRPHRTPKITTRCLKILQRLQHAAFLAISLRIYAYLITCRRIPVITKQQQCRDVRHKHTCLRGVRCYLISVHGQPIAATFVRAREVEPPCEAVAFAGLGGPSYVGGGEVGVYGDGGWFAEEVGEEAAGVIEDVFAW